MSDVELLNQLVFEARAMSLVLNYYYSANDQMTLNIWKDLEVYSKQNKRGPSTIWLVHGLGGQTLYPIYIEECNA